MSYSYLDALCTIVFIVGTIRKILTNCELEEKNGRANFQGFAKIPCIRVSIYRFSLFDSKRKQNSTFAVPIMYRQNEHESFAYAPMIQISLVDFSVLESSNTLLDQSSPQTIGLKNIPVVKGRYVRTYIMIRFSYLHVVSFSRFQFRGANGTV